MTRGLAEISRLGEKLGADPMTFLGLGGIGDLIVTCTSTHSRNYTLGFKLGQGKTAEEALKEMKMVVEGIYTTKSVYHLAQQEGVEMPITNALYEVLFEDVPVSKSVRTLMERDKKQNKECNITFYERMLKNFVINRIKPTFLLHKSLR